jgi:uncharacterized repeat protein (TIGR01451 family)
MTAKTRLEPGASAPSSADESDDADEEVDRPGDQGATETSGRASPTRVTVERRRETRRWTGIAGIALLAGGLGVVTTSPALLLASAIGVGMLAVVRAADPTPPTLSIEREFHPRVPDPGEECTVSVTVTNSGQGTIVDLRLVDLVPDALAVLDGSPRGCVTLRPDQDTTLTYTVLTRRGHHEFDGLLGISRDVTGAIEIDCHYHVTDAIECVPDIRPLDGLSLRSLTTPYAGRQTTDEGGAGIEFHATREYLPGDPLRRIDWNRHARSGELATLEFRTERAASVVVVADVRRAAYVRPDRRHASAADRGVDAVGRLFTTLLDEGDQAGIATLGPECHWLPPRLGADYRLRGRQLLAQDELLSPARTDESPYAGLHVRRLRRRLAADAQVIVCTPLCDDDAAEIVRLLDAHGHHATVVSPDPTAADTPGRRLARAERTLRITRLRRTGIRVVDWDPDESLDLAIARATERWSA